MTKHGGDQAAEGSWLCPTGRGWGAGDRGLGEGARPPAATLCRGRRMKGGFSQAVPLALSSLGSGGAPGCRQHARVRGPVPPGNLHQGAEKPIWARVTWGPKGMCLLEGLWRTPRRPLGGEGREVQVSERQTLGDMK